MKIAALALLLVSLSAMAEDKFLNYKFNDNVVITISNIGCKAPNVDPKKFPYMVLAKRIDHQVMMGCFTHKGDDIVIQWSGGDQSIFPSNVFLVEHLEPNT